MTNQVHVQKITDAAAVPLLDDIRNFAEHIRERAYHLFKSRGGEDGRDLDDWLQAERELIGPFESEIDEDGSGYRVRIAAPGFDAKQVKVTATPNELIVNAAASSSGEAAEGETSRREFSTSQIFRKFELPKAVDVGRVTACLDSGTLKIDAVKATPSKQIGKGA